MNRVSQSLDPFSALFDQLAGRVATILEDRLESLLNKVEVHSLPTEDNIKLLHVYSAKEVAAILGTTRVASVYDIPPSELPTVRRIGSKKGYLGINILCYIHDMPPVDMEGYIQRCKKELFSKVDLFRDTKDKSNQNGLNRIH